MQSDLQASIEHWFAQGPAAIGNPEALSASCSSATRSKQALSVPPSGCHSRHGLARQRLGKQGILLGFRLATSSR